MFECLARACMMLEHGFEASEARGGQRWIPMCHLDLKPANSKSIQSVRVAVKFIFPLYSTHFKQGQ